MHYQAAPYEETKIVSCSKGSVYDVILDLRKDSPTFNKWFGRHLSDKNGKMFYIPRGVCPWIQNFRRFDTINLYDGSKVCKRASKEIVFLDKYLANDGN